MRFSHLIITGGGGYIGGRLSRKARSSGMAVTVLSRTGKSIYPGVNAVCWSLGERLPSSALDGHDAGTTAVVHLAHDWSTSADENGDEGNINVEATRLLLESCRVAGIQRFVFVSSVSARPDALNVYGRVKWKTEQAVTGKDAVSARVGLVYGGSRQGMFGLLSKLSGLPLLPMVAPSQQVQPIQIDELCTGLLLLVRSNLSGWKVLAGADPMTFGTLLRHFARIGHGQNITIIPIPLKLALLGCTLTKYVPGIPTVDKERILGLAGTRTVPARDDLEALGLAVFPLPVTFGRSRFGTRGLLIEARTLLTYVLSRKPAASTLIRYVKAVGREDSDSQALGLPPLVVRFPSLLRFIEPLRHDHPLAKRLALAATLAEASPEGAESFFQSPPVGNSVRLLKLGGALIIDILALPVRLIASSRHSDD